MKERGCSPCILQSWQVDTLCDQDGSHSRKKKMQTCFLERPAFPSLYQRTKASSTSCPCEENGGFLPDTPLSFLKLFFTGYLAAYLFTLLSDVGAVVFAPYSVGAVRNATYSSGTEPLRQGQL